MLAIMKVEGGANLVVCHLAVCLFQGMRVDGFAFPDLLLLKFQ